eukprot:4937766-Pleurochrysis_carterae.AAC.1
MNFVETGRQAVGEDGNVRLVRKEVAILRAKRERVVPTPQRSGAKRARVDCCDVGLRSTWDTRVLKLTGICVAKHPDCFGQAGDDAAWLAVRVHATH